MPKKPRPRIYFISDTHFGHDKIREYCNRPFSSVGEMDSVMMERWNWAVGPKDIVYFLGDFCLGNQETAFSYFKRLNGQIYVVLVDMTRDGLGPTYPILARTVSLEYSPHCIL